MPTAIKKRPKKKTKTKRSALAKPSPLWLGPCADGWNGGVTQSMLGSYLVCKERFRIQYIEGLQQAPRFRHYIEYGQMWHKCEEALAANDNPSFPPIGLALQAYCKKLMKKYPTQGPEINKWYNVCKVQFPLYVAYWRKQSDVKNRTPLMQEVAFDVPYTLPSGRVVRLRGKWDSVDLIGRGKSRSIYLMENKTKGDVDEVKIKTQLHFDLQTMLYLIALITLREKETTPTEHFQGAPIKGVRYNVIRRPLSGGKGSIRQHKPTKKNPAGESTQEYYARLGQEVIAKEPETYFMRWKAEITAQDIDRFKRECLDPVLENLCDDYEWWLHRPKRVCFKGAELRSKVLPHHCPRHFRFPYGVYNSITDGRGTDLDEYLATGSTLGLVKGTELFEELKG